MNLAKRNKGNVNKWEDIPCPWIEAVNTVEMVILPNQSINSTQSQLMQIVMQITIK